MKITGVHTQIYEKKDFPCKKDKKGQVLLWQIQKKQKKIFWKL